MRKAVRPIPAIAAILFAAAFAKAEVPAYHPHPERSYGQVENQRATFLLTEALHRIAMAYDSSGEKHRRLIVKTLVLDSSIRSLLGLGAADPAADEQRIRTGLAVWTQSYPSIAASPGDIARISWEPKQLLLFAHPLIRLSYDLAGLEPPRTVSGILQGTVFGPHPMYQSERIRTLNDSIQGACLRGATALDDDPSAPKEFRWVRWAFKRSPELLTRFLEKFLGPGKSCSTLTRDVLDIVGPHQSPLKSSSKTVGQLEGLSLFLADKFFGKLDDVENPQLLRRLRKLQAVNRLDPRLSEEDALSEALGGKVRGLGLVRLLSLASHNHGLELYLEKAALELIEDPKRAVALASETLGAVNWLYGLLASHRRERLAFDPEDSVAKAQRPYHFWGGALVSCELMNRGYERWVSTLVSGILGKVYEDWTGTTGEGLSGKAEDVRLHIEGAQYGASICPSTL